MEKFSQQRRLKDGKKNLTQAFKSPVTASRICWILTLFFTCGAMAGLAISVPSVCTACNTKTGRSTQSIT